VPELPRFHLAVPVDDLAAARRFYGGVLGCTEGRSASTWIDFDLYGHQLVVHLDPRHRPSTSTNPVDGDDVPVPHFGVLLAPAAWRALADRLQDHDVEFLIAPRTRFAGRPGEQSTMFLLDPAGNALEFKAFADDRQVFAR
jgi:extradiol dioxygenase family protein